MAKQSGKRLEKAQAALRARRERTGTAPSAPWRRCEPLDMWPFEAYLRDVEEGNPWRNLKLVAVETVPRKGNYWLAWNLEEKRLADSSELTALRANLPNLHRFLVRALRTHPWHA